MNNLIIKCLALVAILATDGVWFSLPAFGNTPAFENTIEEIIVTAQRREENIDDVPIAITALMAEDLFKSAVVDIRDLGIVVPGLNMGSQGANLSPILRGVQTRMTSPGAEQPVSIYLDGVYQQNPLFNMFDLVDITRVEVLKGPQGTLFGRNSTGGAIRIETMKPQYETTGKFGLDYGFYTGSDEDSGDVAVKGFISGAIVDQKLAYSLSGYYRNMEGFLTNDITGGGSGEVEIWQLRGKLLWEPTDNASFVLTLFRAEKDDLYSFTLQPKPGLTSTSGFFPDGIVPTKPWHVAGQFRNGGTPMAADTTSASLKAEFNFDGRGTLTSTTAYSEGENTISIDLDHAYSPTCSNPANFNCLEVYQFTEPENFQQEIQFASEQFGQWSFITGLYYYDDETDFGLDFNPARNSSNVGIRGSSFLGRSPRSTVHTSAWAWFGEANYDFSDKLRLIGGLRYSEGEVYGEGTAGQIFPSTGKVKDDAWTPRIALHYDLTDETSVYASYAEGFKSTTIDGGSQSDAVARPEELIAYEIGLKSTGANHRFNASAFYYDWRSQQNRVWLDGVSFISNGEDSNVYGLELDGTYNVTDQLQLRGTIAYLDTEYGSLVSVAFKGPHSAAGLINTVVDVTGDQFIMAPELTASLGFTYSVSVGLGDLQLGGTVAYSDEFWSDFLQIIKQDSYITANATLSLVPNFNQKLRLTFFGRNLTNEAYFTNMLAGRHSFPVGFAPPRQLGVSVDYVF